MDEHPCRRNNFRSEFLDWDECSFPDYQIIRFKDYYFISYVEVLCIAFSILCRINGNLRQSGGERH